MLGEDHSLLHEFPQYAEKIQNMDNSDVAFAKDSKHYDELDLEIRKLELRGAPIDDAEMSKLKHDRATLKDSLHERLI